MRKNQTNTNCKNGVLCNRETVSVLPWLPMGNYSGWFILLWSTPGPLLWCNPSLATPATPTIWEPDRPLPPCICWHQPLTFSDSISSTLQPKPGTTSLNWEKCINACFCIKFKYQVFVILNADGCWALKTHWKTVGSEDPALFCSFANSSFRGVPVCELSQHVTCDCIYNFLIVALPISLCFSITPCLFQNKTNIICSVSAQSNSLNCSHCVHHPCQENVCLHVKTNCAPYLHEPLMLSLWPNSSIMPDDSDDVFTAVFPVLLTDSNNHNETKTVLLLNPCPCSEQSLEFPAVTTSCQALGTPC